jgi:hypothetical protein
MTDVAQQSAISRKESLMGCGLAVLLVVLAGAIVLYGLTYMARSGLESQGRVPEGAHPLFRELVDIATVPGASMYAVDLCDRFMQSALSDGALSGDEREQAEAVRAALAAKPALDSADVETLLKRHPRLASLYPAASAPRG